MKKMLLIITLSLIGCNNQSYDHPCIDYIQNIESLENEVDKLFQNEGKLKEELESAKLYIRTLELENSRLAEMINK